jgi:hypothetical protein
MRASFQIPALVILAFIAGSTAGFLGSSLTEAKHYDGSELRQERDDLRERLQEEEARKKRLESELAQIAKVDFAEYQRLQNEEAQFIKAKEILGKVFLVLFHNVLASVDEDQKKFVLSLSSSPQAHEAVTESPAPSAPEATPQVSVSDSSQKVSTPVSSAWTQAEKDLATMSPDKAEALLQSLVIKDILSEQGSAKSFSEDDSRLAAMQGFYAGEITFLDPKRKPWTLEMDLSSDTRNGQPKGNFTVRIVDETGQQLSRLHEGSNIGGILRPVSESKALIVRVFRTQFLQIYIFEKQGIIIGNFYDELPDGRVEHLGRFKLRR